MTANGGIGQIGQRACRGKRAHSTRAYAEAQLQELIDGGANADLLRAYQCKHCRSWHVGHIGGSRRKR